MNGTDLALAAILAGGASEATGLTNVTPLGPSDDDDKNELPPSLRPGTGGGGGLGGLDLDLPEISLPEINVPSGGGGTEIIQVPTGSGDGPDLPDDLGPGGPDQWGPFDPDQGDDGDGGGWTPPWRRDDDGDGEQGGGGDQGGDPLTNPEPGIQLGDIPFLAGEAKEGGINTLQGGGDFASENPYLIAGTTLGAASPDPITTAGGAAVGGATEIIADTVTGGTPLGVQSPVDLTTGGRGPGLTRDKDTSITEEGITGDEDTSVVGGGLTGDPDTSIFGGGSGDGGGSDPAEQENAEPTEPSTSNEPSDDGSGENKPFAGLPVKDGSIVDRARTITPGGPGSGDEPDEQEGAEPTSSDPASKSGPGTIRESVEQARENVEESRGDPTDQPARGRGGSGDDGDDKKDDPISRRLRGGITGDPDTSVVPW